MNINEMTRQRRCRFIARTADLSACVPLADKSAVCAINRHLRDSLLADYFVHQHYRAQRDIAPNATSAVMSRFYDQMNCSICIGCLYIPTYTRKDVDQQKEDQMTYIGSYHIVKNEFCRGEIHASSGYFQAGWA